MNNGLSDSVGTGIRTMVLQDRKAALAELRRRVDALGRRGGGAAGAVCRLGDPTLDGGLPWGGLPRGALHEVAGRRDGAAAGFAAALLARFAGAGGRDNARAGADGSAGGMVLWCQPAAEAYEAGMAYGPGTAAFGLAARRLVVLRARRPVELLWAMEEGLRCPGVAAVLGEVAEIDLSASRRLQLAAEAGGAAGLLVRPRLDDLAPSVALTRWRVRPAPSRAVDVGVGIARWAVELWRCRGGAPRGWDLEWDEQAFRFAVADTLADGPADAGRRAASA